MAEKKALFIGSKKIGLRALQTLVSEIPGQVAAVITINDISDGRTELKTFQSFCAEQDLPLHVIVKPSELGDLIKTYRPFFVLVVGWYWLIPPNLLSMVPGGYIGLHASLLPKFRGFAPLVWAIILGEEKTGITLFFLENGMDTGEIIDQKEFEIKQEDTIKEIFSIAEDEGVNLIRKYADQLISGTVFRRQQDESMASYVSLRRPEDGKINWFTSAKEIYNFIRAQTLPYPGAYTFLPDGKVVRIWRASIFSKPYFGIPGLIGQKVGEGIIVSCSEGALVVEECELEGSDLGMNSFLTWGLRLG